MDQLTDELPRLAGRRVAAANQAAAAGLAASLGRLGYSRRILEGERIVSDESFFDAVGRAFELGDATQSDWDGMVQGVLGVADRMRPRGAVLWHRADASAFFSVRTVVEGTGALLEARARLEPAVRLEVVLLGQTRDFPDPEEE